MSHSRIGRWTEDRTHLLVAALGRDKYDAYMALRVHHYMEYLTTDMMRYSGVNTMDISGAARLLGISSAQVKSRFDVLLLQSLGLSSNHQSQEVRRDVLREYAHDGVRTLSEIRARDERSEAVAQVPQPATINGSESDDSEPGQLTMAYEAPASVATDTPASARDDSLALIYVCPAWVFSARRNSHGGPAEFARVRQSSPEFAKLGIFPAFHHEAQCRHVGVRDKRIDQPPSLKTGRLGDFPPLPHNFLNSAAAAAAWTTHRRALYVRSTSRWIR